MKDKIHWTTKRILGTVFGILGIGTLTSCYGCIDPEMSYDIYGKVDGKIDGTRQGIKELSVFLYRDGKAYKTTFTDNDGYFEFRNLSDDNYKVRITDVDGDKNGKFNSRDIDCGFLTGDYPLGTITLENAD